MNDHEVVPGDRFATNMPRPDGGIRHVSRRTVDRASADLAVEKVRAVRRVVGCEVDILMDLSGGLTTDDTIRLCRRQAGSRSSTSS
jgi:galactonate dehydratase